MFRIYCDGDSVGKTDLLVDTNSNRNVLKEVIALDKNITVKELAINLKMNESTVRANLNDLDREGFIFHVVGKGDNGYRCKFFRSIYKPREVGKILVVN